MNSGILMKCRHSLVVLMLFVLVLLVLMLSGCAAPTTQIQAFGHSTTKISGHVNGVLTQYSELVVKRKLYGLADIYDKSGAKELTIEEFDKIKAPFTAANRKLFTIIRANNALGAYATSLSELARATSRNDIDIKAANMLYAVRDLNASYEDINDSKPLIEEETVSRIAAAVAGVGHLWVEYFRNREIKAIVLATDAAIGLLCEEIRRSLEDTAFPLAIKQYNEEIFLAEYLDYKTYVTEQNTDLLYRVDTLKRLKAIIDNRPVELLKVQQLVSAINHVRESHSLLAEKLREDDFTGEELVESLLNLRETINHYGDYEEYISGCNSVTEVDGKLNCEKTEL